MDDVIAMRFIKDFEELATVEDSETHKLVIENCSGWIVSKATGENEHYLSTHTFYGEKHDYSNSLLQNCGFNVELSNWDA